MTDDELDAIHERQSARRRIAHKYSAATIADIDALIAHVTNLDHRIADLEHTIAIAANTLVDEVLNHARHHERNPA